MTYVEVSLILLALSIDPETSFPPIRVVENVLKPSRSLRSSWQIRFVIAKRKEFTGNRGPLEGVLTWCSHGSVQAQSA